MKKDLKKLYGTWEDGSKVVLRFIKSSWEIEIERLGGKCVFGKGWHEFAKETELEVGDKLMLYADMSTDAMIFNVCICKGGELIGEKTCDNCSSHSIFNLLYIVPMLRQIPNNL